jgi:hypothetical protein
MTQWAIDKLRNWNPESRLVFAMRLLIWSIVAAVINIAGWLAGIISDRWMIAITLVLSWFALTITAGDIVIGTDVRVQVEEE